MRQPSRCCSPVLLSSVLRPKRQSNRASLALFVLAYNLGNFLRRFALPIGVSHWSLSSIQLKLVKIGAKIISHSRMTVFQMAEVAVPERLFLLDALTNPPPGKGMHEGTDLELLKDGGRKAGRNITCGTTVLRQRENARPGGDMERSVGEDAAESSQPRLRGCNRDRILALEEAYGEYRLKRR